MDLSLPQYHYPHLTRSKILKDVRKERTINISNDQVYFVGFRVSLPSEDKYHHALILASDYSGLLSGISDETKSIRNQGLARYLNDISVIFIRNFLLLDPNLIQAAQTYNIDEQIKQALAKRDEEKFALYGITSEKMVSLLFAESMDGLSLIEYARQMMRDKHGQDYLPLELCQAHPVRFEFDEIYWAEVKQYLVLNQVTHEVSHYVH